MTGTVAVLVIDGFGIGAMPDAGAVRQGDAAADTLGSLARWSSTHRGRPMRVPHLAGAGLGLLRPDLRDAGLLPEPAHLGTASARRAALGYPGADSFAGHQTLAGADMGHVRLSRIAERSDELVDSLVRAGHRAEAVEGGRLVVVDDSMLVHDNLEADPGLNWNVSARLSEHDWPHILEVARVVRAVAPVARVIAVGGVADGPLTDSVRSGEGGTLGLDTPASGFYRNGGLRVAHLGAPVRHHHQLPEVAARAGVPVSLVGKAADLLVTDADVDRRPGVDTAQVLRDTAAGMERGGLVVANVQQTDLAGHERDPARYADLLELVDAALPSLLDGILVVTADHGNDPLVGHAFHTREFVPVLTLEPGPSLTTLEPELGSLAEVGADVAVRLGLDPSELEQRRTCL